MQIAEPDSFAARWWRGIDRPGWRNFGVAMLVLSAALITALFSAAAAQEGRVGVASVTTVIALGPVSYTHLDVYKRQITKNTGKNSVKKKTAKKKTLKKRASRRKRNR